MEETTTRISFKFGNFEVDCHGSEEFLKSSMVDMVTQILDLCCKKQEAITSIYPPNPPSTSPTDANGTDTGQTEIDKSINTIALDMGVKSGPDLIMAAVAYYCLVKGHKTVTRDDIAEGIKTATSFYNTNHTSNLTKNIKTLVKNKRLHLHSKDTYALPEN